jgi:cation transport regulator ChaC
VVIVSNASYAAEIEADLREMGLHDVEIERLESALDAVAV